MTTHLDPLFPIDFNWTQCIKELRRFEVLTAVIMKTWFSRFYQYIKGGTVSFNLEQSRYNGLVNL
jgi:hypothetical protein